MTNQEWFDAGREAGALVRNGIADIIEGVGRTVLIIFCAVLRIPLPTPLGGPPEAASSIPNDSV